MRCLILIIPFLFLSKEIHAQGCCSGGSGSPIAGGASQGVLLDRQAEIAMNYQYFSTNRFMVGDRDTTSPFDRLTGNYSYYRLAYGLTKNLTMSVETGYYFNKSLINSDDTITSSGIGDLIFFPRYDLLNISTETTRTEITVGLGIKIPLGKYNDSTVVFVDPTTEKKFYNYSPPTVQPTNGSNDFIFYGFLFRGYPAKKLRVFANMLYIRKGWNSLGQKFGDYATVGLFAGKTFFKKIGVTLQVKGEWLARMKYDKNVDMIALYGIDVNSTGGRKISFAPQVSFSHNDFTVYALSEIPIYQYVNGNQVASKYLTTLGISYRFIPFKGALEKLVE